MTVGITTASLLADDVPKRRHEEETLHRSVVQFLKWSLPSDAVYFHIPNGGQRHKRAAARMVGLGVRAGIPDLCIIWRGRVVFIELKAARGVVSAVQRQMAKRLILCGAVVLVCRSVDDVASGLAELQMPLLGRLR